jgi:hypothetical protein
MALLLWGSSRSISQPFTVLGKSFIVIAGILIN